MNESFIVLTPPRNSIFPQQLLFNDQGSTNSNPSLVQPLASKAIVALLHGRRNPIHQSWHLTKELDEENTSQTFKVLKVLGTGVTMYGEESNDGPKPRMYVCGGSIP